MRPCGDAIVAFAWSLAAYISAFASRGCAGNRAIFPNSVSRTGMHRRILSDSARREVTTLGYQAGV